MIKFPTDIDSRIFFSDLKASQLDTEKHYQELLSNNKLTDATQYINSSSVSFIGADLLNMLQDELIEIEKYISNLKPGGQLVTSYAFPKNLEVGTNWISSRDDLDNSIAITSASELYTDQDTGIIE